MGHDVESPDGGENLPGPQVTSVFGKKRAKNGKCPGPQAHEDLVQCDFSAREANKLWYTDITEHWIEQGKRNLCAIKNAFPGWIVDYSISDRMHIVSR